MSTFNEHAETDCPVSLETLAELYRSDRSRIADAVRMLAPAQQAQLAMFCYGRSHLREIGLLVAACCDAQTLARVGGVMGQVLATQSRGKIAEFGREGLRPNSARSRITLAKAAA